MKFNSGGSNPVYISKNNIIGIQARITEENFNAQGGSAKVVIAYPQGRRRTRNAYE